MTDHDIPLNTIVTPNEVIEIASPPERPRGIYWGMLPPDKIDAIPILKRRKRN
jgi:5-formyltetrahydrofolate cyclo-ligase